MDRLELLMRKVISNEALTCAEANELHRYPKKKVFKVMDKITGKVKLYYYLITFTLDPEKNVLSDELYDTVESYISKQMKRIPLCITESHIVREGGDLEEKHTHWHASVICEKPLKKDRFNYYVKLYGNIHISKSRIQSNTEHLDYMSKQSTPIRVV